MIVTFSVKMVGLTSIFGNHDVPKLGSTKSAPGEMNEDEKNQVKDSLQKFTELAKRLEEVAEKVFGSLGDDNMHEAWKETLSAFTTTGDYIDGIEHFEDGPEDAMKEEMDVLAAELETLLSKLSINIEKMKTLSEKNFCNEVLSPAYLLTRYMKNCVAHPKKESTDRFDEVYEDHTPLKVSYTLLSCLRIQGTNPVKSGMQKWKQSIQLVIGLLMYVEAFAIGLQGTESELNLDLIIKACVKIFNIMKNWEEGNSEEEEEERKRREEEERKRKEEEEARRREEEERKQREEEERKRKEEEERRRREEEEQKQREEEERKRKEEEERKKKEEEERKRQEEEERKRREEEEAKKNLWPNIKIWTEQFLINNTQMPNGQKADQIRNKVEQVISGTSFYVALFDAARPQIDYSYYNPNGDNQLIYIMAKGGCDCLIYRSFTGNQESAQSHANLKSRVQSYRIGKVSYNRTLEGVIEKQILPSESWKNNFVLLVWTQKNTEVRWMGPGCCEEIRVKDANKLLTSYPYFLTSSFP
ncbi:unnamed protein product [Caenorhabditis brenneri]